MAFIDAHRDSHWVGPICAVLPIAESAYYEHPEKRADQRSGRIALDRTRNCAPEIRRVLQDNWSV